MKKKKLTALLLVLCMGVAALSGCGSREDAKEDVKEEEQQETEEENKEPEEAKPSAVINIGAMKGPTAMGMAQLLDDENYNVSIVASPDEITVSFPSFGSFVKSIWNDFEVGVFPDISIVPRISFSVPSSITYSIEEIPSSSETAPIITFEPIPKRFEESDGLSLKFLSALESVMTGKSVL